MKISNKGIKYTYGTVDELVATGATVGEVCVVTEDGRGGTFKFVGTGANNGGTIFNGWHRIYDGAVNIKWFDVTQPENPTIQDTINTTNEALSIINTFSETSFTLDTLVPDGKTLISGLLNNNTVATDSQDNGYSYDGYKTKTFSMLASDTSDNDSKIMLQSPHHSVLHLFNSQGLDTGVGGIGQSDSSLEGKCSISMSSGFQSVNGRDVPNSSSRIQRYRTGGIGDIHIGIQHPTETGVGTRTLFDFTSSGNASFGGQSAKDEYNLLVYPNNTNTPAGDKRTTIGLRNVQPSGNGTKIEMVARDVTNTNSCSISYNSSHMIFNNDDSLDGSYTGSLEQVSFPSANLKIGSDTYGTSGKVHISDANNLTTLYIHNSYPDAFTGTALYVRTKTASTAYNLARFYNDDKGDVIRILGNGDIRSYLNGAGFIVKSPDGLITKRIGIDNSGNIVATNV